LQICRVVGTVVSTQKNRKLEGAKLLLVQPLTLEGDERGVALIAVDAVGAGVGERVLVVIEGKAAGDALGKKGAAVDAAVVGIVDTMEYQDLE
jgi:ethanolamine utilization protein EutN